MITTERLLLRRWREDDREPYAAMMADPEVTNWLGGAPTREVALASIDRFEADFERNGYGFLAVERRTDRLFVGAVELMAINPALPLAVGHEVGWRLARSAWGRGYASEAALAMLRYGFEKHALSEIVAFTANTNSRSRAVMERIGMRRDTSRDFDHPAFEPTHPLRRHVVYAAEPASASIQKRSS